MATINWPSAIKVGPVDYAIEFDVQMTIARSGRVQTFGMPGARWTCSIHFENDLERRMRPAVEALIASLEGGANRLSMPHWGRPRPNGTLTGTPILNGPVVAGAKTINITSANGNLKAGDILGLPGQIFMVTADVAMFAGNLSNVPVTPAIRSNYNSGTAVSWNKPTTLWIPRSNIAGPFPFEQARFRPGFTVEFAEVW